MSKNVTEIDDTFDFGFTSVDSKEIIDDTQSKIDKMLKLIDPLLNNLSKNPEKDMINWPNRAEKIAEFRKKLYKAAGKTIA